MPEALFWGFAAASALLAGAGLAMVRPWSRRAIGLVTGFGVGALISAVTLDLTVAAFEAAGAVVVVAGLVAGAIVYSTGNWLLHRGGVVRHRKRSGGQQAGSDPLGIVLGTILDGIPESIVIGITVVVGGAVGVPFLAAVAISNVPEAVSATTGLLRIGWSRARILRMWTTVVLLSAASAGVGYAIAASAPAELTATLGAFAAGAVLTMLADTMMPEAFEEAGTAVGFATVMGYAVGALLVLA